MTFSFKGIDHILLAAPKGCENEARRFFGEIFGLLEIEKPEPLKSRGGVWFQLGNQQIHVGVEEPFIPARKAHPALKVENIEALREHLIRNGISVVEDDELPGAKRFYVNDPFGNRIEILEWIEEVF